MDFEKPITQIIGVFLSIFSVISMYAHAFLECFLNIFYVKNMEMDVFACGTLN